MFTHPSSDAQGDNYMNYNKQICFIKKKSPKVLPGNLFFNILYATKTKPFLFVWHSIDVKKKRFHSDFMQIFWPDSSEKFGIYLNLCLNMCPFSEHQALKEWIDGCIICIIWKVDAIQCVAKCVFDVKHYLKNNELNQKGENILQSIQEN